MSRNRVSAAIAAAALIAAVVGTGAANASKPAAKFKGTIKIATSVPVNASSYAYPEIGHSVKAAVDAINRAGGIKGYKIVDTQCDNQNSPNPASQCAQQAVAAHVVAMVGNYSLIGGTAFYPSLDPAKIPSIGNGPSNPADWTDAMSFPISYTPASYVAAAPFAMKRVGCTKVSVMGFNDPAYNVYFGFAHDGIQKAGMTVAGDAKFPSTTTDFSSVAAQVASQGANCALSLGPQPAIPGELTALQGTGKHIILGGIDTLGDSLPQLGKKLDGSPFVEPSPTPTLHLPKGAPIALQEFVGDMKADHFTSINDMDINSLDGWLGVRLFQQAAEKLPAGKVTAAGLIRVLNKTTFSAAGVVGTTNFAAKPPVSAWPRLHNYVMFEKIIKNGKKVSLPHGTVNLASLFAHINLGG